MLYVLSHLSLYSSAPGDLGAAGHQHGRPRRASHAVMWRVRWSPWYVLIVFSLCVPARPVISVPQDINTAALGGPATLLCDASGDLRDMYWLSSLYIPARPVISDWYNDMYWLSPLYIPARPVISVICIESPLSIFQRARWSRCRRTSTRPPSEGQPRCRVTRPVISVTGVMICYMY